MIQTVVIQADFYGNDVVTIVVAAGNIQYCAQACKSTTACNHFTYVPDTTGGTGQPPGTCWMKNKLGISPANAGSHAGLMSGILY